MAFLSRASASPESSNKTAVASFKPDTSVGPFERETVAYARVCPPLSHKPPTVSINDIVHTLLPRCSKRTWVNRIPYRFG